MKSDPYAPRQWLPHEKPTLPGSPSTPLHPWHRRLAYGLVGILVSITGGLGNALVTANLTNLQGSFGAYSNEIAWLPAVYLMTNVSINLLLVKFRQQYGLRVFTEAFLVLYVLVTFFHLFVNDLSTAMMVRAAHGMVGAALSSLSIYYQIQAFPAKHRLKALTVGIGIAQMATPLARLFSSELLALNEWRGLYLFELGLALVSLAGVLLMKLPPSDRIKVFEKLDFLTFMLMAPGMALLCGVLSLGKIDWWQEAPWIGWSLAASVVLIVSALVVEHQRRNPLLNTRWLSSGAIIRLGLIMILMRIVLSEQNTGAIGYLQQIGLLNDQMRGLSVAILLGMIAGVFCSALTVNPKRLPQPIIISLVLMMFASLMDAHSNSLTRPENFYFSQFLLGFGGAFFLAPALLAGIGGVVAEPRNLVSFSVLFGMSQNIGGLLGAALLGTFQVVREKFHSSQLTEQLTLANPLVAERVNSYTAAYGGVLNDSYLQGVQGLSQLQSIASREANTLAYNDVYLLTAAIALVTLVWILWRLLRLRIQARRAQRREAATAIRQAATAATAASASEGQ